MPAKRNGARATAARKRPGAASARERLGLAMVMKALESAGTEQNRKIYLRHGAEEPLFGVSFAELKDLVKRIGVDHELACALWKSGNSDARTLAIKIADPGAMGSADLDRWVASSRFHVDGVAQLAAEGKRAQEKTREWLCRANEKEGRAAWCLVALLASRDETLDDAWFGERLAEIEAKVGSAPNLQREAMAHAIIAVGGRSPGLRKAALATAKRIGRIEIDHGETGCKTPDAAEYIEKTWAHARAKGFASPAAQERSRESVRVRC